MTIQEMQERKKETGITYAEIARRAGLPLPTVQKVLSGTTKSPRYDTILALEKVLSPSSGGSRSSDFSDLRPVTGEAQAPASATSVQTALSNSYNGPYRSAYHYPDELTPRGSSPLRGILAGESQPAYNISPHENAEPERAAGGVRQGAERGRRAAENAGSAAGKRFRRSYPPLPQKQQGEYTAADRESLPEEFRTELIDGVLYDMASPRAAHQIVLMNLSNQLFNQIEKCGRDCMVFVAPSDVWLTKDDKNIFQPDIYVLCDYAMIGADGYTKGAPPFIVEIVSPSTRSRDFLLKSYKYHAAGVREYWIVDPENRQVTVYNYDKDPDGTVNTKHSFEETISVGLSGGSCSVDFSRIAAALDRIGM